MNGDYWFVVAVVIAIGAGFPWWLHHRRAEEAEMKRRRAAHPSTRNATVTIRVVSATPIYDAMIARDAAADAAADLTDDRLAEVIEEWSQ